MHDIDASWSDLAEIDSGTAMPSTQRTITKSADLTLIVHKIYGPFRGSKNHMHFLRF